MDSALGDFSNQGLSSELVGLLILNELKCFRKELTNEVKSLAKKLDRITTGDKYCQNQPPDVAGIRKMNSSKPSWQNAPILPDLSKSSSGSFKEISPESDNSILNNHIAFRMSSTFTGNEVQKEHMGIEVVYPESCSNSQDVEETFPELSSGNASKEPQVTSAFHDAQDKDIQVLDTYHVTDSTNNCSELLGNTDATSEWHSSAPGKQFSGLGVSSTSSKFSSSTFRKKPIEKQELLSKCSILYKCTICDEQFETEALYKSHYSEVHENVVTSQDLTTRSFWKDQSIKNVFDQPQPKIIYTCKICSRAFSSRGSLLRHSVLHSGVKKFVCKICGKRFFRSDHLKSHLPTHSRQKQFQCNLCHKYFSRSTMFEQHMKMHQLLQFSPSQSNLNAGTFDGSALADDTCSLTLSSEESSIVKTEQAENL